MNCTETLDIEGYLRQKIGQAVGGAMLASMASFHSCFGALEALGWLAAIFGLSDLMALGRENRAQLSNGLIHAIVNGSTLGGFTVILILEYGAFPAIAHGAGFLTGEAALIIVMFAGNYFGGAMVWSQPRQSSGT